MSDAVVVAKLTGDAEVRLVVSESENLANPVYSSPVQTTDKIARLAISGLNPDTSYHCGVEVNNVLNGSLTGRFRTKPAGSFRFCFATCSSTGSSHAVFPAIVAEDPDFFLHLGDLHYQNINSTDIQLWLNAYDAQLAAGPGEVFRNIATYYVWDDHDYGPNDSDGSAIGRDAACQAFRRRVPHPPLVEDLADTDPIYYAFEVGRCVFIVTDLRSESSPRGNTDNASKTMMGATQKAWFKSVLSDPGNDGKFFFWCCSRIWLANAIAGHDSWGGFTTERTELADFIEANCPGRIAILTGDRHQLGIDDGSNADYVTGGGGTPVPVFMAAPLDQSTNTHGGGTFSSGVFSGNGQYGLVEVADGGGATITIDFIGRNAAGATLTSYQFAPALPV